MKNWLEVNQRIQHRDPCTSFEDNTYYTIPLFEHFCDNRDYKYVAIFGYYKNKYDWTDAEAQQMYNKVPDGWTDGLGVYRLYDWGKGANKIACGEDWEWHEPQLDHIVPKSRAKFMGWPQEQINHPDNFQVLPALINRILSNLTDEMAPAILPMILAQFPGIKINCVFKE
jgi:hypothetical protein